jgi:4'-phosphopantetheinyl transferase EntD
VNDVEMSGGEESELRSALESLAPPDVRVGCRRIAAADLAELRPVEAGHVRSAVPARQREFASGRALLRALTGYDGAIPAAPNRSAVLPYGVRGSLAHDRDFAVAAVSRKPSVLALGIDVEPATPLEPEVAALVLRDDEDAIDAHLAFTMKEAAYKAWSALGGRVLDHDDVLLAVSGREDRARILPNEMVIRGRWTGVAGRWIALVVVDKRRVQDGF